MFTKITRRSKLRSNFDLAKLPPTSEAAHEHLFRVYLQVQAWLGNKLDATEWGWKMEYVKESGGSRKTLTAVPSSKPFTPDDDLHLVSCSCKSSCGNYCGCRKVRLNCSTMCEKKLMEFLAIILLPSMMLPTLMITNENIVAFCFN